MLGNNKLKVLFFCQASSYSERDGQMQLRLPSWVDGAISAITEYSQMEVHIAIQCPHATIKKQIRSEGTYYTLSTGISSIYKKWWYKISHQIALPGGEQKIRAILSEVAPDLICVFGTEFSFAEVQRWTNKPVILHLQSIVQVYLDHWFDNGMRPLQLLFRSSAINLLKGSGSWHAWRRFRRQGEREKLFLSSARQVMGRTEWDKKWIQTLGPHIRYFHCEEVMRAPFYDKEWTFTEHRKDLHLVTVINPNIYKGLELIMQISRSLQKDLSRRLKWSIVGIEENDEVVKLARSVVAKGGRDAALHFTGALSAQEVIEVMLSSDLFVHLSHIENSANSICEALLLGMPVAAMDTGGTASLVQDRVNGILLTKGKVSEMAAQLLAFSQDGERMKSFSRQARIIALQRHNRKAIVARLEEIFNTLVQRT
jgi:glycosyltransferase involved in cell wall biosynthesis